MFPKILQLESKSLNLLPGNLQGRILQLSIKTLHRCAVDSQQSCEGSHLTFHPQFKLME